MHIMFGGFKKKTVNALLLLEEECWPHEVNLAIKNEHVIVPHHLVVPNILSAS